MKFSVFTAVLSRAPSLSPPLWLIAVIAGVPIFSETMYTPALPHIAKTFCVKEALVEYTASIYFLGTSLGVLLWGNLSDVWGRRKCVLTGTLVYLMGCIACMLAPGIKILMAARFLQALGASMGAVLAQTISYDISAGGKRGKIFSTVGGVIAVGLAIGPACGGLIDQYFGWRAIFGTLIFAGSVAWCLFFLLLSETHPAEKRNRPRVFLLLKSMLKDRNVLFCASLIGLGSGMHLSYTTEGPFFMMNMVGLSPTWYGLGFALSAAAAFCGALWSRHLHNTFTTTHIIQKGVLILALHSFVFTACILAFWYWQCTMMFFVLGTWLPMMGMAFGRSITVTNCLSLAIENFGHQRGAANAVFVCMYYLLIALFTTGMGTLHNDTVLPLPLYLGVLGSAALILSRFFPKNTAP